MSDFNGIDVPFEKEKIVTYLRENYFQKGKITKSADFEEILSHVLTGYQDHKSDIEKILNAADVPEMISLNNHHSPDNSIETKILDLTGVDGSFKFYEALGLIALKAEMGEEALKNLGAIASTGNKAYSTLLMLRRLGVDPKDLPFVYIADLPETECKIRLLKKAARGNVKKIRTVKGEGIKDPYQRAKDYAEKWKENHSEEYDFKKVDRLYKSGSMAGVIGLALKLFIENGVPDYYIQGTSGGLGPIAFYLASELYAEARKSSGDTDYINPLHVVLAQSENSMPFGMIGPGIQDYDSMVHHADEHYQSVGAGINQVLKTRLPSRQFFDFFVGLYNKRRMKVYLVSDIELGFTRRYGFEDASCSALVAYDKATDGSTGNRYIKNGTVWISNTGNNQ